MLLYAAGFEGNCAEAPKGPPKPGPAPPAPGPDSAPSGHAWKYVLAGMSTTAAIGGVVYGAVAYVVRRRVKRMRWQHAGPGGRGVPAGVGGWAYEVSPTHGVLGDGSMI
jgi:hypothetical protein